MARTQGVQQVQWPSVAGMWGTPAGPWRKGRADTQPAAGHSRAWWKCPRPCPQQPHQAGGQQDPGAPGLTGMNRCREAPRGEEGVSGMEAAGEGPGPDTQTAGAAGWGAERAEPRVGWGPLPSQGLVFRWVCAGLGGLGLCEASWPPLTGDPQPPGASPGSFLMTLEAIPSGGGEPSRAFQRDHLNVALFAKFSFKQGRGFGASFQPVSRGPPQSQPAVWGQSATSFPAPSARAARGGREWPAAAGWLDLAQEPA